jgi:hypothetical protein
VAVNQLARQCSLGAARRCRQARGGAFVRADRCALEADEPGELRLADPGDSASMAMTAIMAGAHCRAAAGPRRAIASPPCDRYALARFVTQCWEEDR